MFIATLIAADTLQRGDISAAADRLAAAGCAPGEGNWIDRGLAWDQRFAAEPGEARAALEGAFADVDVIVQPEAERVRRLLVSDMDSTMITVECIDELADYAGIKPEIAAITEAAMAGELDFEAALDARVALLKGLPVETLAQCYHERVEITPGAHTLIATLRARGGTAILVSGGFEQFAAPVAEAIGFDRAVFNRLGVANGRLDGTVARPVVGAQTKRMALAEAASGLAPHESLALGDGANDVPMIVAAGLGVAWRAKRVVEDAADACLRHADLTALLYAQGIPHRDWVTA